MPRFCCNHVLTSVSKFLKRNSPVLLRAIGLYTVTAVIIVVLFHNNPYSLVFLNTAGKEARESERMLAENRERLRKARQYLGELSTNRARLKTLMPFVGGSDGLANNGSNSVAITIVAKDRHCHDDSLVAPCYLTQVLARILQIFEHTALRTPSRLRDFQLFLCAVDGIPTNNILREIDNITAALPVKVFQKEESKQETNLHKQETEKQDYVYCIGQTLAQSGSAYLMVVEDDALPHRNLVTMATETIARLRKRRKITQERMHAWWWMQENAVAWVKLYHPPRLLGYFDPRRLPELFAIGVTFGSGLTFLYNWIFARDTYLCWAGFTIFVMLVAMLAGRPNLLELRRLSRYLYVLSPVPSCCTPAVLYSRRGAQMLVRYLRNVTCGSNYGKDMAMDDFLAAKPVRAFLLEPSLFTHIGMYSLVRDRVLESFIV